MVGVGGGSFQPNSPATVASAVTVLGRLSGVESAKSPAGWAKPYLDWAEEPEIRAEGLAPNAPITREQMAYLLTRYVGEGAGADVHYADLDSVDPDYLSGVRRVRELGLMLGRSGSRFDPQGSLTRSELAAILHRVVLLQLRGSKAQ